jgi:hypothetical protein
VGIKVLDVVRRIDGVNVTIRDDTHIGYARCVIRMNARVDVQPDLFPTGVTEHRRQFFGRVITAADMEHTRCIIHGFTSVRRSRLE